MMMVGPIFLLSVCALAYRLMSKMAYKKGLNEVAFGIVGIVATFLAGGLSWFAGAALDPAHADVSGMVFGGFFFIPMDMLYLLAIYLALRFCPADAGDMHEAVLEHRRRGEAQQAGANADESAQS